MKTKTYFVLFAMAFMAFMAFAACLSAQQQLTNLPAVFIQTVGGATIYDKINYIDARLTIRSSIPAHDMTDVVTGIRGRGNSTWKMPKKPYRIKLDKKARLFDANANAKSWVLLANYADKTLMRNAIAFKISELVGLDFTPTVQFVDLYLNNQYLGNYMLTDQIQEGKERVEIDEIPKEPTETELTGGYLLEIDGFTDETWRFTSSKNLNISIKYPDDDITSKHYIYIRDFINKFEERLFAADFTHPDNGYRTMTDTASLINWYIASELTGNSDAFWSTYIYKKREIDKIFFGPLWDYDIAFNNDIRLGDAQKKLMRENAHLPRTWIEQMWRDPWFRQAVERRWNELVASGLEASLTSYIDATTSLLNASQQQNFSKWKIFNQRVHYEYALFGNYQQGVDFLRSYIVERIKYLNQAFFISENDRPTPPFAAENFYYIIMNRRTHNVIDVKDHSNDAGAQLHLWQPVEEVASQLWKIEPIDNTYFCFINKQSGLVLTANGLQNNLLQTERNDTDPAKKWKITPAANGGFYGIESAVEPYYYSVNNSGGGYDNGTPVIVYNNRITESENQQWYISKRELITANAPTMSILAAIKWHSVGNSLYINNLPDDAQVVIYNIVGQPIQSTVGNNGQAVILLPKRGIYVLSVGNRFSRKIVF
ncbi:MAG: CotH kinase family protein [Tannerella sp.]|nr:CotH kinase family protein [Tannerella sp.]